MSYAELIHPLIERRDLDRDQAMNLMRFLMSGEATDAQIGGALIALRIKGCTTQELASFATILREHALMISHSHPDLVDTCGTGGGAPSFNISTAAALIACAAGAKIAKHGNRAQTSACGSADVLEALGVVIHADPERLLHVLDTVGIVFLFAQAHHQAMRHVGPARKDLQVRTIFNQLGPLMNPAGATRQLIGVYDPGLMRSMGEALNLLGAQRALIVHGDDELDEISPVEGTHYIKVWDGRVTPGKFTPRDFGLDPVDSAALLPGRTLGDNAHILREAVSDPKSVRFRAVQPSAAAAIWLAGLSEDLVEASTIALDAVSSGKAAHKLNELIRVSQMP
ncbi:MAG TPA: anthranilate phosphoribosyltransferase [Fimbriimonadaceae bacterium]|nr:anthranilate phosphoribosyltransferase [Fimbriimonadaceae bacterium]